MKFILWFRLMIIWWNFFPNYELCSWIKRWFLIDSAWSWYLASLKITLNIHSYHYSVLVSLLINAFTPYVGNWLLTSSKNSTVYLVSMSVLVFKWWHPAKYVHFFYACCHLNEPQNCNSIISTKFSVLCKPKYPTTYSWFQLCCGISILRKFLIFGL